MKVLGKQIKMAGTNDLYTIVRNELVILFIKFVLKHPAK